MAGKVVNSSFVLLSKFGATRQESASKTATSHIRKTLWVSLKTIDILEQLIGKEVLKVQRLDSDADYEFYSPHAIIFTLDSQNEKLIISAINDGSSVDTRMISDEQVEDEYGLEFGEHILNDLKKGDELNAFVGEKIQLIRVAEFIDPEIKGPDFVIKQGKLAGIELKTETHKLLFQNNNGGWCDIDDDVVELSDPERWRWKEVRMPTHNST